MKKKQTQIVLSLCLLILFTLWTVLLHFVDRQAIGPLESMVGLASLNQAVHNLTGVHMDLYQITDWLGLVPFCMIAGFASLGLYQWIRRKHLFKVDRYIDFENRTMLYFRLLMKGLNFLGRCKLVPTKKQQRDDFLRNSSL
jgi:undecaprenyl-diphosphatase